MTPISSTYNDALTGFAMNGMPMAPVLMTGSQDGRHAVFVSAWDCEAGENGQQKLYQVDMADDTLEVAAKFPNGETAIPALG